MESIPGPHTRLKIRALWLPPLARQNVVSVTGTKGAPLVCSGGKEDDMIIMNLNPLPDGPLASPLTDGPRSDWTKQKTVFDDVS